LFIWFCYNSDTVAPNYELCVQLVVSLDTYVKTLESTKGVMDEFVNPK